MKKKKVIVSIETLPDEINSYLYDNYEFYDLSPYLKDYKSIKNYNINNRERWDKVLNSIPVFGKPEIVIFRTYTILDKKLIDIFPENILYLRAGSGYDNIDIKYALSKNCKVQNTPLANTNSAFEHTIALLTSSIKKLNCFDYSVKNGKWRSNFELNSELLGKKICIIGYGNIGYKVAKFSEFMGMKIYIFDPIKLLYGYYDILPEFKNTYESMYDDFDYQPLFDILKEVDIITFHVPLYDKTYKMIDEKLLSYLKDKIVLINTSRGELFDQNSVINYFKKNKNSFLATDVLPQEPCYENSEFLQLPNSIITPHIGAYTFEARNRLKQEIEKTINIYFQEGKVLFPVNPAFYFSPYFYY